MTTPSVGMIVRVVAVDWNRHFYLIAPADVEEQVQLARATIYGQIVKLDNDMIAIAHQVFDSGTSREVIAIPLGCVESVEEVANWGESMRPVPKEPQP